jgi:hypothetical protein
MMSWVIVQSTIFHPGDTINVSTIFKRARTVEDEFIFELEKMKINFGEKKEKTNNKNKNLKDENNNNNEGVDSNGRGVLDFPKVRVTRETHSSRMFASRSLEGGMSAHLPRGVTVLSTNLGGSRTTRDPVKVTEVPWKSSMDFHAGLDLPKTVDKGFRSHHPSF